MKDQDMRKTLLLLTALTLAGCNQAAPTAPEKPAAAPAKAGEVPINTIDRSHAGEPGPAVVWEMKGGTKQKLADHQGMRMLVNLWATWCAPCIAEMPALDTLAGDVPVMVLPISQDMEGWQAVDKFWGKDKFKNIETGLDQPGSFAEAVKAKGLPVTILYDEAGKEIWRVAGTLDWASAEVRKAIVG
ncbi:TlpA family protein disulfide reductase [Sandarakinorhabdus sp.]|uniref:TlpA family protein disulfide reductase n=1 Tax=Sandarakinorhabdus sp. TaxID=1916663 RepID=UPI0035639690